MVRTYPFNEILSIWISLYHCCLRLKLHEVHHVDSQNAPISPRVKWDTKSCHTRKLTQLHSQTLGSAAFKKPAHDPKYLKKKAGKFEKQQRTSKSQHNSNHLQDNNLGRIVFMKFFLSLCLGEIPVTRRTLLVFVGTYFTTSWCKLSIITLQLQTQLGYEHGTLMKTGVVCLWFKSKWGSWRVVPRVDVDFVGSRDNEITFPSNHSSFVASFLLPKQPWWKISDFINCAHIQSRWVFWLELEGLEFWTLCYQSLLVHGICWIYEMSFGYINSVK